MQIENMFSITNTTFSNSHHEFLDMSIYRSHTMFWLARLQNGRPIGSVGTGRGGGRGLFAGLHFDSVIEVFTSVGLVSSQTSKDVLKALKKI